MDRTELIDIYEYELTIARRKFEKGIYKKDEVLNIIRGIYDMYRAVASEIEVSEKEFVFEPTEQDKKKYTDDNNELVSILKYRGFTCPIYFDDPGEQFYCFVYGQEVSGGSFNTEYIDEFLNYIDTVMFDEEYDWYLQNN